MIIWGYTIQYIGDVHHVLWVSFLNNKSGFELCSLKIFWRIQSGFQPQEK